MTNCSKKSPHFLSRRTFMGAAGATLFASICQASAAPPMQPNGLYVEPWIFKTSGDLGKDFGEAVKAGKNFAIVWEMRNCPWCKVLHMENFASPEIAAYLQENFILLQLNLRSAQEMTDFQGEKLPQEELAFKFGIQSTPTFQFFKPGDASTELGRAGYLQPSEFFALLRFIREKGYDEGTFQDWARSHRNPA